MRRQPTRAFLFATVVLAAPLGAWAQAPSVATDPLARPVMHDESAAITNVIDAFDLGSMWSFRLSAIYSYSQEQATIQRERSAITGTGSISSSGVAEFDDVARYSHSRHTLTLGAELPLWHDLALTFALPLILSDSQSLDAADGESQDQANQRLSDGYRYNGNPTQLFSVPFRSPTRSGIDQIYIGARWNILNQARDPHLPTWLLRLEWRAPVGPQMNPCQVDNSGNTVCPDLNASRPSTYDTAGGSPNVLDPSGNYARSTTAGNQPGISRGVHGFYVETVVSRRVGYIEPYIGMDALLQIPNAQVQAFRYGDMPYGQLSTMPPITGSLVAGTEIIPWENRESWQRVVIDVSARGQYVSQGRDYSPLFDALGSSNSIPLTSPQWPITDQQQGRMDPARAVWFSGATSVHSYAVFTGQFGLAAQPLKFLRLSVGGTLSYITSHMITATDACNPNVTPPADNQALRGGCVGDAVPDPQHRPVIDSPGQRFRVADDWAWGLYANLSLTPRF